MAANKYSKLCIDKSKITEWIQLWCEANLTGKSDITFTENANRIQYTINNEGKVIKIDFIKCNGGLLTITPKVGVNIPISTQIADSICERVVNVLKDSPFANGFSIWVSKADFDVIIELIECMEGVSKKNYSEQLEEGRAQYYLYQFQGSSKDSITIKYFLNTGRMQLQGKPLFLFNEVVSMVSENGAALNDVVDAQLRYCSIDIPKDDIYEEMKKVLGDKLFNFLSSTQKAILSTAFILSKIEIAMPDYSGIIQQALRAYEGFTKKVYAQKGLECEGDKQLGVFFARPDKMSPFVMKQEYAKLLDSETEKQLTSMYTFYHRKRHPHAHATANDFDTAIITNRQVADELFNEIISKMKASHENVF